MNATKTTLLALALAGTSGLALAQQDWTEVEDGSTVVEPLAMTVDELDGADLYGPDGERIGELDDVMMDANGTDMAVSVDVGGFLGIGEKDVLIPVSDLSVGDDGITVPMTQEELEAMPEFDD